MIARSPHDLERQARPVRLPNTTRPRLSGGWKIFTRGSPQSDGLHRETLDLSIFCRKERSFDTSKRTTSAFRISEGFMPRPSALSEPMAKFLVIREKPVVDASNLPSTVSVS